MKKVTSGEINLIKLFFVIFSKEAIHFPLNPNPVYMRRKSEFDILDLPYILFSNLIKVKISTKAFSKNLFLKKVKKIDFVKSMILYLFVSKKMNGISYEQWRVLFEWLTMITEVKYIFDLANQSDR